MSKGKGNRILKDEREKVNEMNFLKNEIVGRISKIIELKDMVIVRYNNPLLKDCIYRVYLKSGGGFTSYSYTNLLDDIAIYRVFNRVI